MTGDLHPAVSLGIGDDAAIMHGRPGQSLCVCTDVLVNGVHFPAGADPAEIGQRALRVNLSDLAAMGARPVCFTLGLTLPSADERWLSGFSSGLFGAAEQFGCSLMVVIPPAAPVHQHYRDRGGAVGPSCQPKRGKSRAMCCMSPAVWAMGRSLYISWILKRQSPRCISQYSLKQGISQFVKI